MRILSWNGHEGAGVRTFRHHAHKCEHFHTVGLVLGGRPCGVVMSIILRAPERTQDVIPFV